MDKFKQLTLPEIQLNHSQQTFSNHYAHLPKYEYPIVLNIREPIKQLQTNIKYEGDIIRVPFIENFNKSHGFLGMPKNIIFEFDNLNFNLLSDRIKSSIIKSSIIQLTIGDSIITELSLNFLYGVCPKNFVWSDNKLEIQLIFDWFIFPIHFPALQNHDTKIFLIAPNELNQYIKNIYFVVDYIALTEAIQYNINHSLFEMPLQQLQTLNVDLLEPLYTHKIRCHFNHMTKGIFIQSEELDSLNSFVLQMNGHDSFHMNQTMIDLLGYKLSPNMLYISFFNKSNYSDLDFASYEGGYNSSKIDTINFILHFERPQAKLQIHIISLNIQKMSNGKSDIIY